MTESAFRFRPFFDGKLRLRLRYLQSRKDGQPLGDLDIHWGFFDSKLQRGVGMSPHKIVALISDVTWTVNSAKLMLKYSNKVMEYIWILWENDMTCEVIFKIYSQFLTRIRINILANVAQPTHACCHLKYSVRICNNSSAYYISVNSTIIRCCMIYIVMLLC